MWAAIFHMNNNQVAVHDPKMGERNKGKKGGVCVCKKPIYMLGKVCPHTRRIFGTEKATTNPTSLEIKSSNRNKAQRDVEVKSTRESCSPN